MKLRVKKFFRLSESGWKRQWPAFDGVLAFAKKHSTASLLVCNVDRLGRDIVKNLEILTTLSNPMVIGGRRVDPTNARECFMFLQESIYAVLEKLHTQSKFLIA